MSEPLVCAVMLTRDRPEMARRAINCFLAQKFSDGLYVHLGIINSGGEAYGKRLWEENQIINAPDPLGRSSYPSPNQAVSMFISKGTYGGGVSRETVGNLRNQAVSGFNYDVIIHWDDDDWSHPNRISEQVAFLQSSGAEAVGYRDMLFWRTMRLTGAQMTEIPSGKRTLFAEPMEQAYLYSNSNPNYCLGTSLCYWRKTWERRPFEDLPKNGKGTGEDSRWLEGVQAVGATVFGPGHGIEDGPVMIASMHGGNTMKIDIEDWRRRGSREFKRVPGWDQYCRERMTL